MRWLLVLLFWLSGPLAAAAGDIVVSVRTPSGAPVADAVVSVEAPHAGPIRFAWPYRMTQHDIQFDPFVLVVPVGADVAFPNLDTVRHHVYSFSATKTFELKLYGRDETRVVHFDKAGVVDLHCNIHDDMIAYIDVVDTPFAAKTDAQGLATLHGVPGGDQSVKVWRPYMHTPGNMLVKVVPTPRDGVTRVSFVADVRMPPMSHSMY
ncbi:MAG TPA: methylamine utilization protein [Caulobacteraceae bacterium]|nr:methylamine utilization protein [Caulobacteraceae bacterium]